MDLKLLDAQPTRSERAAVDGVLGPPASGWRGGEWRADLDGHVAHGGAHRAAEVRHLLLPALHAVQGAVGWISPGALSYVSERLTVPPAEAYAVATFYAMFATEARAPRVAHVCDDVACRANGADEVIAGLQDELGPAGDGEHVAWVRSPCLGRCEQAPVALLQLAGEHELELDRVSAAAVAAELRRSSDAPAAAPRRPAAPQTVSPREPGLRLLRRVGVADPESLDDYRANGGYPALRAAVRRGPDGVIREVKDSRLLGRGGAAFPMGVKWEAVARAPARPHYVVCNADESEPGTFKDRVLMEEDPFAVVEAMTIAGYATGAEQGYLYVRGEYPKATARLENAVAQARARGLLGGDVMGEGFRFDVEIRRGAGAYICGEETALFNSIEGFRGEPRNKPPYPTQAGLFGKPTVVNNVETLANVADIVLDGGPAFAATGTADSTGPKLFCVSGSVDRPGLFEVPFGTTLGQLLELAQARPPRAVLLGGAAGFFVGPDRLDLRLTFEDTRAAGLTLGSGAVVAFDDTVDLEAVVLRIAAFFRDESCGQCVPCRVGTVRQEEALRRIAGNGAGADLELIDDIARVMKDASICGLGHTASGAVQSAIALGIFGAP